MWFSTGTLFVQMYAACAKIRLEDPDDSSRRYYARSKIKQGLKVCNHQYGSTQGLRIMLFASFVLFQRIHFHTVCNNSEYCEQRNVQPSDKPKVRRSRHKHRMVQSLGQECILPNDNFWFLVKSFEYYSVKTECQVFIISDITAVYQ